MSSHPDFTLVLIMCRSLGGVPIADSSYTEVCPEPSKVVLTIVALSGDALDRCYSFVWRRSLK